MNKKLLSSIVHFAVTWLLCASPVSAQIDVEVVSASIVWIRAYDNNKVVAEGSGFVVNEKGYILTNAHLLAKAEKLTASSLKPGAEVALQRVFANRATNLALLHGQDLNLPPLHLSEQGANIGRTVQTLRFGATGDVRLSHGTIGAYQDIFGKKSSRPVAHLLQHNALITTQSFGMPLFNECGDVVAINLPDPSSSSWPFRKAKPKGTIFALRSGDIIAALRDREIVHTVVKSKCLSAVERAERARKAAADSLKAAKAQADLASEAAKKAKAKEEAARQAAAQAKARADAASKAAADSLEAAKAKAKSLAAAKARADAAKKAVADSLEAAKAKADSLEAAKAKADSLRAAEVLAQAKADSLKAAKAKAAQRLQWGIVAGVGLVLLALLGWLLFSRRKLLAALKNPRQFVQQMSRRATRKEATKAIAKGPKHGLALAGFDSRGDRIRIELSPAQFASQRLGLSLGRHPDLVDETVADENVSRRHLRIAAEGDQFYVEDLNSSNGTFLNDQRLSPFKPAQLDYGTKVALGDLVLTASKL